MCCKHTMLNSVIETIWVSCGPHLASAAVNDGVEPLQFRPRPLLADKGLILVNVSGEHDDILNLFSVQCGGFFGGDWGSMLSHRHEQYSNRITNCVLLTLLGLAVEEITTSVILINLKSFVCLALRS